MTKLLTPIEVVQALQEGKKVEVKFGVNCEWTMLYKNRIGLDELLEPRHSFRLAQEMITIGDVSFPKPVTEPFFECGQSYYFVDLTVLECVRSRPWSNDSFDQRVLNLGLVHLSKENAIAHAKALIKLSGGSYE